MNLVLTLLVALQIVSALAMIGLILVQHGKGADMGAAFGSGSSGSLFGASGSANFLSRTTAVLATVFLASTLALAYFGFSVRTAAPSSGSVLERAAVVPGGAASAPASAASEGAAAAADIPAAQAGASAAEGAGSAAAEAAPGGAAQIPGQ